MAAKRGRGERMTQAGKALEVTEQTSYRRRKEHGGTQLAEPERLKHLEGENARLRRAVADPTESNRILQEAAAETL